MSEKLTDWFSADVKPVRAGVYEIDWRDSNGRCFYFFDGQLWADCAAWQYEDDVRKTCERASTYSRTCHSRVARWRGLAEQPK